VLKFGKETIHNNNMTQYIWIDEKGNKAYFSDKEMTIRHREDGPALETVDGLMHWYNNGLLHRKDGPAMYIPYEYIDSNGKLRVHKIRIIKWFLDGKLHRVGGPAVIHPNGDTTWYHNGLLHRTDGPAVVDKNCKSWYIYGKLHREDGPAIEGDKGNQWYIHGQTVTRREHYRRTGNVLVKKLTININGKEFTLEELNALIETAKGNSLPF
tara:strand:+ start:2602 stop:3234 length:633 start_codon:yes stop_codon:yes gene_type:complete